MKKTKIDMNWIADLKGLFFDRLYPSNREVFYEEFLDSLVTYLLDLFQSDCIAYYLSSPWKERMLLKTSAFNDDFLGETIPRWINRCDVINQKESGFCVSIEKEKSDEKTTLFYPMSHLGELKGIFLIGNPNMTIDQEFVLAVLEECTKLIESAREISDTVKGEKRHEQLFKVTEKFHSTMNMDAVLNEIIKTLREVFPLFSYNLLLSQDIDSNLDLPIKDLELDSKNIAAMQAYVSGTIQFEDSLEEKKSILYAPLKGKQGVYGVLQVIAPDTVIFPKIEIEFITILAKTAGSALENAQLYQQSKRLISNLQLINETSHRLNSSLRLGDTMNYMREQICHSFFVEEVGFFMIDINGTVKTLPGSSAFFHNIVSTYYVNFVKIRMDKDKDSLFIGDLDIQYPDNQMDYKSLMAVPMIQSGTLEGFAIVIHKDPYHFSFEMFKLMQSLIHHSTLAFANSMLREELEKMVVTDHLTGLYSRNYLEDKIMHAMTEDSEGTFILIDIDNFKTINDTFGHQTGDDILIQVSEIIKKSIRDSDIGTRWGGEELAIFLPRVSLEVGHAIAVRLVEKVRNGTKPMVTISCGLSYWRNDQEDNVKAIFKRADEALYQAKRSGKDKVVIQNTDYTHCLTGK